MLQQTRVKAVLPYYEAFVGRFPSVEALAAAEEESVLAAWSGLGYYHRARYLHRGARHLVERHGGRFPRSLEAALAVPGVGLYTASAVLSIAFGRPLPVVDGNVRRVLARLRALRGPAFRREAAWYNVAQEMLDERHPGEWNQALMELGATVCTPRDPGCPACPLARACAGRRLGLVESLPETPRRRRPVDVTVAAAVIREDGRVLFVRREAGRLMGRLWEIPQTSLTSRGRRDLERELLDRRGLEVVPGRLLTRARHAITFRRIRVEAYSARLQRPAPDDADRFRWLRPEEVAAVPVSSLTRKILKGLASPQLALPLPEESA
jgi:A/G-specific adenine glycosylase